MATGNSSSLVAREDAIIGRAAAILERRFKASQGPRLSDPHKAKQFVALKLSACQREVFLAIWMDAQCHVLEIEEMALGTISQTHIYPREFVRSAIRLNACRLIIAHNHPSGGLEFSTADRILTDELRKTLRLIDVRLDDHLLVGNGVISLANVESNEQFLREEHERKEREERAAAQRAKRASKRNGQRVDLARKNEAGQICPASATRTNIEPPANLPEVSQREAADPA